jgi:hypothetical protein
MGSKSTVTGAEMNFTKQPGVYYVDDLYALVSDVDAAVATLQPGDPQIVAWASERAIPTNLIMSTPKDYGGNGPFSPPDSVIIAPAVNDMYLAIRNRFAGPLAAIAPRFPLPPANGMQYDFVGGVYVNRGAATAPTPTPAAAVAFTPAATHAAAPAMTPATPAAAPMPSAPHRQWAPPARQQRAASTMPAAASPLAAAAPTPMEHAKAVWAQHRPAILTAGGAAAIGFAVAGGPVGAAIGALVGWLGHSLLTRKVAAGGQQ